MPNICHKFTSLKSRIALQVARKIVPFDSRSSFCIFMKCLSALVFLIYRTGKAIYAIHIFTMEKRISVFIGRTIFFTSEKLSYQHFVLSLVKKIVRSFCSQHGRRVGEGVKERNIWLLCKKEKEFFE